jgi:glycosyltransferase involved in cell wall biosynthesis
MVKKKASLSVVIPVYNENSNVLKYIDNIFSQIKKLQFNNFELIIVDDHSTNNTYKLIKENLKKKNIKITRSKKNYGPGNSIRLAATFATKENIMWIGADDDVDLNQYLKHVNKLNKYKLLIFYIKNNEVREFSRRFFSFLFTKILNFSFMTNIPYFNGITLMNRKNFLDLNIKSKRFFFSAEIKILSLKKKYNYIKIPFYLRKKVRPNLRTILNKNNWHDVIYNYFRIFFIYYFK